LGDAALKTQATVIAGLLASLFTCESVLAQPHQTTKYSYYSIQGDTPGSIYATMIKRGPRVGGVKAYAKTLAVSTPYVQILQGKTCKLQSFSLNFSFDINLPKLKNESAVTGRTKAEWKSFARFLKTHEETHRRIWLAYGSALEAKVRNIKAGSCAELAGKIIKLREQMTASCNREQEAFDAAQQRVLLQQPFVKLVLAQASVSTTALKVQKKK
jgi:predicted secreted Zn-dependent protease